MIPLSQYTGKIISRYYYFKHIATNYYNPFKTAGNLVLL